MHFYFEQIKNTLFLNSTGLKNEEELLSCHRRSFRLPSANISWDKCRLCQVSRGTLVCPTDSPNQSQRNNAYESLTINLESPKIWTWPASRIRKDKPDVGDGILYNTSVLLREKWHKACSLRFSGRKFGKHFWNSSKQQLAQSENFGGEEPVLSVTRTSEPMAKTKKEMYILYLHPTCPSLCSRREEGNLRRWQLKSSSSFFKPVELKNKVFLICSK